LDTIPNKAKEGTEPKKKREETCKFVNEKDKPVCFCFLFQGVIAMNCVLLLGLRRGQTVRLVALEP